MWALVTAASLCGVFAQSFLFGIVFVRLSRADARASTVAFSSCAIVRAAHGALFLAFRVAEMRKRHHLLGVRARAYAFVDIGDGTECFPLPLEAPAPSGDLLLATPALIVHRLDDLSPLVPPHPSAKPAARAVAPPPPPPPRLHPVRLVCGLMSVAGSVAEQPHARERVKPREVAGGGGAEGRGGEEEGRTAHLRSRMEQIREHMRAQSVEVQPTCSLPPPPSRPTPPPTSHPASRPARRRQVLVLLEGTDATTSSAAQARHPAKTSLTPAPAPTCHPTPTPGEALVHLLDTS